MNSPARKARPRALRARDPLRICITGWPQAGKSALAKELGALMGIVPLATDSLIETHEWSEASEEVSRWFDRRGPWIIEGVTVPRALRKWHARHPARRPPCDALILLPPPPLEHRLTMKPGQLAMGTSIDAVLAGLEPWLRSLRAAPHWLLELR